MSDVPAWGRQPTDTERSFKVFQKYLHMINDEKGRSLHRLAIDEGYADKKALEKWSTEKDWVERAAAFDVYMSLAIVEHEIVGVAKYQLDVVEKLTQQINAMNNVLDATIAEMNRQVMSGMQINTNDLKRLMDSIRLKDDLARRVARLPTNYMSQPVEDDNEQMTYIIGAD